MRLSGVILDFFIFFYDKILQAQKAQKDAYKQTKIKYILKNHLFTYLCLMLFMLIKTSKKKKVASLTFLCFFMFIKNV